MNHSAIDWNKRFMYTKTLSAMLLDLDKQSVIDIREKIPFEHLPTEIIDFLHFIIFSL